MSPDRFEHQLSLVTPLILRKSTKLRSPISAAERLTLSYATWQQVTRSNPSHLTFKLVDQRCQTLLEKPVTRSGRNYVKRVSTPKSPQEWKRISEEFSSVWNFPHCIGAGNGKHVVIDCPENTGSNFFNDKGAFSIVLLAYGDVNYCFTAVDVGQYGSGNDSGAFVNSDISKAFESNSFNVPEAEHVQGCADKLPYVTVVDEGLSLKQYQMRSYPGKDLMEERAIFNCWLSRARRIIENIFGILVARWRIFRLRIRADVATVERIVLACVALHNYLRLTDDACYSLNCFINSEDNQGEIGSGDWRKIVSNDKGVFRPFLGQRAR